MRVGQDELFKLPLGMIVKPKKAKADNVWIH